MTEKFVTPESPEWTMRMLQLWGRYSPAQLRERATTVESGWNREWLETVARRLDDQGIDSMHDLPVRQLPLLFADHELEPELASS